MINAITATELVTRLNSEKIRIIDIRSAAEYQNKILKMLKI